MSQAPERFPENLEANGLKPCLIRVTKSPLGRIWAVSGSPTPLFWASDGPKP